MAVPGMDAATTLQKHIEDMRNLVQCKICLKPLYEPYMLACGHTYCYSCLTNWFNGNADRRRNKNCPDCRAVVKVQPAPNYLLRDLTHMFIGRAELLPEDETVADHVLGKEEEAAILSRHKASSGPGLFQGAFKVQQYYPVLGPPIRDLEDGVERCPQCAWEIEDGICLGCGFDWSEGESGLSDEDLDLSDSDEGSIHSSQEGEDSLDGQQMLPNRAPAFFAPELDDSENDDVTIGYGQEDALDFYDTNDDFIDDEVEEDVDDVDAANDYGDWHSDATPYSESTSEITPMHTAAQTDPEIGPSAMSSFSDVEDSDEDEVVRPARRIRHRRGPRAAFVISDDDDDDDDDDNEEAESRESTPVGNTPALDPRPTFYAPDLVPGSLNSSRSGSESPGPDSGSDSDSDSAPDSQVAGLEDESGDLESSDDTAIPPQTNRARRQRLRNQRASRQAAAGSNRITIDLVTPPSRSRGLGRPRREDGRRSRATPVY